MRMALNFWMTSPTKGGGGGGGAWDSANDIVHYIYLKLSYFKNVYMFNLSCMHLLLLILSPVHLRGH